MNESEGVISHSQNPQGVLDQSTATSKDLTKQTPGNNLHEECATHLTPKH
jgi:hypothetical protein